MDNNYDNLKRLFDQLKSIGFWGRIFSWKSIRNLMIDAAGDLQKLQINNDLVVQENTRMMSSNADITRELKIANEELIRTDLTIDGLRLKEQDLANVISDLRPRLSAAESLQKSKQQRIDELESDLRLLNQKQDGLQDELTKANARITQYDLAEETRIKSHATSTGTLKEIQDGIQAIRKKEEDDRHQAEINRIENLKLTWSNHEEDTKQAIKMICSKHTITYVEKVPFKGEPDNTLQIAGEYIIFDAKSPRSDDLSSFTNYIKEQTEKVKKYVQEENVKKWIFLVVPANTLEVLKTFVYPLADYDVFIITKDALEPVILSLRKIEEYDFADQMNPEDRENICRVLGRFAHLSKRRIQIDTYFINQFMELAYKSESDLPPDILEKVMEFEKAEKLNPPQEKRAKAIPMAELEKTTQKLRLDTMARGILIEDSRISTGLNELPLYKSDSD